MKVRTVHPKSVPVGSGCGRRTGSGPLTQPGYCTGVPPTVPTRGLKMWDPSLSIGTRTLLTRGHRVYSGRFDKGKNCWDRNKLPSFRCDVHSLTFDKSPRKTTRFDTRGLRRDRLHSRWTRWGLDPLVRRHTWGDSGRPCHGVNHYR